MQAPQGQEFMLRDGTRLQTLKDLYDALEHISTKDWGHFVTAEKNDFARWIELALDDRFFAAQVRRCRDPRKLRRLLFVRAYR